MPVAVITSVDAKTIIVWWLIHKKGNEINLLLSPEQLIELKKNDAFYETILKLINEKKLSSPSGYFVDDEKLLNKVVREDNPLGHSDTTRTYQYLQ